jgi:hypothetical protein
MKALMRQTSVKWNKILLYHLGDFLLILNIDRYIDKLLKTYLDREALEMDRSGRDCVTRSYL